MIKPFTYQISVAVLYSSIFEEQNKKTALIMDLGNSQIQWLQLLVPFWEAKHYLNNSIALLKLC